MSDLIHDMVELIVLQRNKNIPTLLIYRKGEMVRQLVGLGERRMKTTAKGQLSLLSCLAIAHMYWRQISKAFW